MTDEDFCQRLERGLSRGTFDGFAQHRVSTARAAEALCATLRAMMPGDGEIALNHSSPLRDLLYPFQNVSTREAANVIRDKGTPLLIELSQRSIPGKRGDDHLVFVLKLLCLFGTEAATREVLRQARAGRSADDFLWSIVCSILGREDNPHPYRHLFCDGLRDALPEGFLGVCYLDLANTLARQEADFIHPFDQPEGHNRLRTCLASTNPDQFSFAHSATAALPFISRPHRDELLALAMDHTSVGVQIEAAWAAARLGSEGGVQMLARYARDVNHAVVACRYLIELDREDAIPAEACDADFQAMAEMSQWLQHPNEYGKVPDQIEVFDTRTLYWPPTEDERQLWLIRYRYNQHAEDGSDDVGVGLVGSITFALFGETTAELTPLEVYALHCCWELETTGSPRAPAKRSIEAGLALLEDANPGLTDGAR